MIGLFVCYTVAMKQLYLLRHGERNSEGVLTEDAERLALTLSKSLPKFAKVIASDAERAVQTAKLLAGTQPKIDKRAGFFGPAEENSRAIYEYGLANSMSFFDAAEVFHDGELAEGIHEYAAGLNQLLDETLTALNAEESALIVSHDLTITTAIALKGIEKVSSNYLSGYKIDEDGAILRFAP